MTRILFLTCPELGQCNVHLAVTSALRETHPDIDTHLASYEKIRSKSPTGVTFHTIRGIPIEDSLPLMLEHATPHSILQFIHHKASFIGCVSFYSRISTILHPEKPSEYLETVQDAVKLIEKIKPDICVLDALFDAGADACQRKNQKFVLLNPQTFNDAAKDAQGLGIFSWPLIGLGYRYPMSIIDSILSGIGLVLCTIYLLFVDPRSRRLNKARHEAGYKGPLAVYAPHKEPVLCMSSLMELEYPGNKPDYLTMCGPILLPSKPVSQLDEKLYAWLKQGPVILIVLGSHVMLNKEQFYTFKSALQTVLEKRPDMRVLWKLMKIGEYDTDTTGLDKERVKIVDWLEPTPRAVMDVGTVALSINHGGSNSYHEALITGTPQVICSTWADCHDKGPKVEYIGIGKWGNRKASPSFSRNELTGAILDVVGRTKNDRKATKYKARAVEVQGLIKAHIRAALSRYPDQQVSEIDGRYVAANVIASYADDAGKAANGF